MRALGGSSFALYRRRLSPGAFVACSIGLSSSNSSGLALTTRVVGGEHLAGVNEALHTV
jgi:hypothetical protein